MAITCYRAKFDRISVEVVQMYKDQTDTHPPFFVSIVGVVRFVIDCIRVLFMDGSNIGR
jgi:hypothetical protein